MIRIRAGKGETPDQVSPKNNQTNLFMKGTMKVKTNEMSKFMTASGWADVEVTEAKVVGPNTLATIKYNDIAKVVELGSYLATLTDAQVKEDVERRKKEAAGK